MKKSAVFGSLLASIIIVAAAYLTNIGQEMAVRIGNLSGEELHRLPSLAVLNQARQANATTDSKEIMIAFHMILNAQLSLIAIAGLGCGGLIISMGRRPATPPAPPNAERG